MSSDISHFEVEHLHGRLRDLSVRGIKFTFLAQITRVSIQLVSIVLLSRLVSPEAYGLVAMVSALTMVLTPLCGEALGMALIQRQDISHDQASWLFWVNILLGSLLCALLVSSASPIARVYGQPDVYPIAIALAVGFPLAALPIQSMALLRRQMRFRAIAAIDVASLISGVVVGVLVAMAGLQVWALVVLHLGTLVTRAALSIAICGWVPGIPRSHGGVVALLRYGTALTGAALLGRLHDNILPILLARIAGPAAVGYFSRANTLVSLPNTQILPALTEVLRPALSRLAPEPERLSRTTLELMQRTMVATMIVTVVTLGCADLIIGIVLGPGWEGSVPYARWLSLLLIVQPSIIVLNTGMLAAGRPDRLLISKFVNVPITASALVLGQPFGTLGLVAAFVLAGPFGRIPFHLWLTSKTIGIGIPDFLFRLMPVLASGSAAGAMIIAARSALPATYAIVELFICLAVAMGTYGAVGSLSPQMRAAFLDLRRLLAGNGGAIRRAAARTELGQSG